MCNDIHATDGSCCNFIPYSNLSVEEELAVPIAAHFTACMYKYIVVCQVSQMDYDD